MKKYLTKNNTIQKFLDFYKKGEKLKTTTRHSWLSDPFRQESVAEHSWMLCLLAMLLSDQLKKKIDLLKVIKMVTIHDLAESLTGDIPSHEISARKQNKHENEKKAFQSLVTGLPKRKASEILKLWNEMEKNVTNEAKFANALDKMEVLMQHNIADISTWSQGDFNIGPYYKDEYFNFDSFMRTLKNKVDEETMEKIIKAKAEKKVASEHLERYKKSKKNRK